MAEMRIGHGWTDNELNKRIAALRKVGTNFPLSGPESQAGTDWRRYYTEAIIGRETPGAPVPGGAFEIGKKAVADYQFSDPAIVTGHFSKNDPVEGRTMALEIKIFGLHYLCGVRIGALREDNSDQESVFAFRYDTLEGHMEIGSEWFTLTKKHDTGEVWFRISASWRPGKFPNWYSRVGFAILSRRYQLAWHRLAYLRLREIVGSHGLHLVPVPHGEKLSRTGPEIVHSDLCEFLGFVILRFEQVFDCASGGASRRLTERREHDRIDVQNKRARERALRYAVGTGRGFEPYENSVADKLETLLIFN